MKALVWGMSALVVLSFQFQVGTTYIPLRAVSDALVQDVSWIENTRTVLIQDEAEQQSATDTSRGNTKSNLANGGWITGDSDWLYVSYQSHIKDHSSQDGLYRMKADGSQAVKLTSHVAQSLNVDEAYIYFTDNGVYRLNKNGGVPEPLSETGARLLLVGEWLYVSDDSMNLYMMIKDGTEQKKLPLSGDLVDFEDHTIYYTRDHALYKSNVIDPQESKIMDFAPDQHSTPIIHRNKIYYHDFKSIYSVDVDGAAMQTVYTSASDLLFSFYLNEPYLYVSEGGGGMSGNRNFTQLSLQGDKLQSISQGGTKIFGAADRLYTTRFNAGYYEWYYYENNEIKSLLIH
ncbi:DUF5050 domain-containing protein [Paenibacillus sp. YYML68]|uniref:DUF5050 domain-containing protein n=1 Tax=Paenibacillus sp. YYML68 TaxID=2909250 RepID=UPI002492547F|nr:DUF5050 domain-containing protein [Paenibacillus sp. YYML68]